ncbi:MAG: ankyrin repeat domain-containing protein [Polymorphobacter sp.]
MRAMVKRLQRGFGMLAALALVGLAVPAAAQFSESYNFLKAVKDKDGAKANEILDKPGNTVVNTRDSDTGETGLHITTRRSDANWTGFLLQKGANANSRDREGNTPVMLAAQARWTEGVKIFTSIKVQLDLQNRLGETALQKAVQNRDTVIAKMLVDAGASPDITDNSGTSARMLAESDPRGVALAKLFKEVPVRKARTMQGPSL